MPKKPFIPQQWEVCSDKNYHSTLPVQSISNRDNGNTDEVERIVSLIEQRHADIAPAYGDWVRLGFALVDGFGENGRDYFLRLSALHVDCTREEANGQYTKCLHSRNRGITLSTFFHMAKLADIPISNPNGKMGIWQNGNMNSDITAINSGQITKIPNTHNGKVAISDENIFSNTQNTKLPNCKSGKIDTGNMEETEEDLQNKWNIEEKNLPMFPEEVYKHLPPFLKRVTQSAISPSDRDVILIGALTVLSSTLGKVYGIYDERIVYPNLYLFVTADAGMGKGALTLCRELVSPLNAELRAIAKQQAVDSDNKKDTPMLALIIPANSSASAFIKLLADNNGTGLMFETEGDTLSQTLKSDYGNYSDVLRKAYHHEAISQCRCKDREFLELDCPKLSVALAGTPEQVDNLVHGSENGLFSRFCFYCIKFERNIRNVFAVTDAGNSKTEVFHRLGEDYKSLLGKIHREAAAYKITIAPLLQSHFTVHYNRLNNEACDSIGNRMQGIVRRNGLMAFRIMMILTIVRHLTDEAYNSGMSEKVLEMECADEDYHVALAIAETLLCHSAYMFRKLEKPNCITRTSERADKREILFGLLSDSFTKQEYLAVVRQLGYNESTCTKWIDRFIAENRLRHCGHSKYEKIRDTSFPTDVPPAPP